MKLSEKIIKLRKERGLSQEEFGNEINVSRQAVSKWENEETKPDIDKIQEIVRKFDVPYEYLLNDEIDNLENINKSSKINMKKLANQIILKIILILFLIYLLFCIYKFIVFYRFYLIANSFSEENYSMNCNFLNSSEFKDNFKANWHTEKVGNQIKETASSINLEKNNYIDSEYEYYDITFIDKDEKTSYNLSYDKDQDKYIYIDNKKNIDNEEEYFDKSKNIVRENTLSRIPSNFKEILLKSIDLRIYYVSIINREFRAYSNKEDFYLKVRLNDDYLVQYIDMKSENDDYHSLITYSYDYVQDHFKELEEPLEIYKDKIIYEE